MDAERIIPQDIQAEESVIAHCLQDEHCVTHAVSELKTEYFNQAQHKIMFDSILSLFRNGTPVDLVTIMNELKSKNKLDAVGGAVYLASLTGDSFVSFSSLKAHCRIIKEKYRARMVADASYDALEDIRNNAPIESIVSSIGKQLACSEDNNMIESSKEISTKVLDRISGVMNGSIDPLGMSTGFYDLDNLTSGLRPSQLIILAARPSMGKTTLAMNIAVNVASHGDEVLVFSLEMSKDDLIENQISALTGINNTRFQKGLIRDDDWPKIVHSQEKLANIPLYIDDSSSLRIDQITSRAKLHMMSHNTKLIVVDYLSLARGYNTTNKVIEVGEISAGLKALAKDMNIPVIALSQLSRKCEERNDKRPMLSDLRESGSIEQDADVAMFVYRDEMYNKNDDNPLKGIAEIIVSKNRRGRTGVVRLGFNGENCRFENLVQYE